MWALIIGVGVINTIITLNFALKNNTACAFLSELALLMVAISIYYMCINDNTVFAHY